MHVLYLRGGIETKFCFQVIESSLGPAESDHERTNIIDWSSWYI